MGEDYPRNEIASHLNLSVSIVDNHRQHICGHLELRATYSDSRKNCIALVADSTI